MLRNVTRGVCLSPVHRIAKPSAASSDSLPVEPGKYARFELERRFLVHHLPEGIAEGGGWLITDRYITETRLRLRRMEPLGSGEAVFKLGQKEVPSPPNFSLTRITNLYLSRREYGVLAVLPARELQKRRYRCEHDGEVYSIDVFEGHLAGLVLAEIGFETTDEMNAYVRLPAFVSREVSQDVRYTGGGLAAISPPDASRLIEGSQLPRS